MRPLRTIRQANHEMPRWLAHVSQSTDQEGKYAAQPTEAFAGPVMTLTITATIGALAAQAV